MFVSEQLFLVTALKHVNRIKGLLYFIFSNWWPLFVLIFYALCPVPMMLANRFQDTVEASSALIETCIFLTAGVVVSAFGLPIVLAHTPLAGPVVSACYKHEAVAHDLIPVFVLLFSVYPFIVIYNILVSEPFTG